MVVQKKAVSLHRNSEKWFAQMAESVDALVSNTSGFTSIPVRPRVWVQGREEQEFLSFFCFYVLMDHRKIWITVNFGSP